MLSCVIKEPDPCEPICLCCAFHIYRENIVCVLQEGVFRNIGWRGPPYVHHSIGTPPHRYIHFPTHITPSRIWFPLLWKILNQTHWLINDNKCIACFHGVQKRAADDCTEFCWVIRKKLCTGHQPIVNTDVAWKATDWSKFCQMCETGNSIGLYSVTECTRKLLMSFCSMDWILAVFGIPQT